MICNEPAQVNLLHLLTNIPDLILFEIRIKARLEVSRQNPIREKEFNRG